MFQQVSKLNLFTLGRILWNQGINGTVVMKKKQRKCGSESEQRPCNIMKIKY